MHNSDFEAPPLRWSLLSIVGGIITAIALIIGLEIGSARVRSAAQSQSNTSQPNTSQTTHSTGAPQPANP